MGDAPRSFTDAPRLVEIATWPTPRRLWGAALAQWLRAWRRIGQTTHCADSSGSANATEGAHGAASTSIPLVAICGAAGSGKSTLARALVAELAEARLIPFDDYRRPRAERAGPTPAQSLLGSRPEANDLDRAARDLAAGKAGRPFEKPVYDLLSGTNERRETIKPGRWLILEGEMALYGPLAPLVDLAIVLEIDPRLQLETRVARDTRLRSASLEKAVDTFLRSDIQDYPAYGGRARERAALILRRDARGLRPTQVAASLARALWQALGLDRPPPLAEGCVVALCTPFGADGGIDFDVLGRHLDWLGARGVERILLGGTTGEFFSLLPEERRALLAYVRPRVPGLLIMQVGAESMAMTTRQIRWAEDLGADMVAALPPYYLAEADPAGLIEALLAIAAAATVPFLLYNFPRNTGNPLTPAILRAVPHVALKDSSANLELIPHAARYLVGGDNHILESARAGGVGFVSGLANCAPTLYLAMERACRAPAHRPAHPSPHPAAESPEAVASTGPGAMTDVKESAIEAEGLQTEIRRLCAACEGPGQIGAIKALLGRQIPGYPPHVRPPLRAARGAKWKALMALSLPTAGGGASAGDG